MTTTAADRSMDEQELTSFIKLKLNVKSMSSKQIRDELKKMGPKYTFDLSDIEQRVKSIKQQEQEKHQDENNNNVVGASTKGGRSKLKSKAKPKQQVPEADESDDAPAEGKTPTRTNNKQQQQRHRKYPDSQAEESDDAGAETTEEEEEQQHGQRQKQDKNNDEYEQLIPNEDYDLINSATAADSPVKKGRIRFARSTSGGGGGGKKVSSRSASSGRRRRSGNDVEGMPNPRIEQQQLLNINQELFAELQGGSTPVKETSKFVQEATQRRQQNAFIFPKAPIYGLIKEILGDRRIYQDAVDVLQLAVEEEIVKLFQKANLRAEQNERETVKVEDLKRDDDAKEFEGSETDESEG